MNGETQLLNTTTPTNNHNNKSPQKVTVTFDEKLSPPPPPPAEKLAPIIPRTFRKRWLMLAIFVALSLTNAFQWIQYSIISNIVVKFYGVPQRAVDWTSMIYMFAYIPLIWPASWILDKYGLRLVALLGAFGNAAGAWIKCASADPDRFAVTFLGQTIVGASQIFILGLPPRLAAVWFGPKEVSTACALGVFGNQLGIAFGFVLPPMIVRNSDDPADISQGFSILFFASAGLNTLVFLAVFFFFKDSPPVPPSPAQLAAVEATMDKNFLLSIKKLFKNWNFILLVVTYGLNVGAFYAVSTLLNQMVLTYFEGEELNVGRIGLLIVLAGMAGSVITGIWLDRTKTFKMTTVVVYLFSCIGMILYTVTIDQNHLWVVFLCAGLLGFFMTGYLPLGFEFGAELTYPISEGTTSGVLNAAAQIFGILETQTLGLLIEKSPIWVCNTILCVVLGVGTILTGLIRSDLRRLNAGKKHESENPPAYSDVMAPEATHFIQSDSHAKIMDNEDIPLEDIKNPDFRPAEDEFV